ncbi:SRPBCC domain-containing protein [Planctomycetota bacterium]|nr:SRPBCC domain-containing protein [Planctomycetota bacterium]
MPVVSDQKLVIERVYQAPPRVVFDAWMKPELRKQWFTPKPGLVSCTECVIDARVGGEYEITLDVGEGKQAVLRGKFLDIEEGKKIVFTSKACVEPADAEPSTCTVEFKQIAEGTHMTFTQVGFYSEETKRDQREGWNGCFDELKKLY